MFQLNLFCHEHIIKESISPKREDILEKKRLRERARRERINNDPELKAIQKNKERLRYEKKKQKKLVKKVKLSCPFTGNPY